MLFGLFVVLFIFVCIILCFLVLIQADKGGGISGAIGGSLSGASNVLGSQDTANILTKATTIFAISFMGLCIILSLFLSNVPMDKQKSVLKERAEKQQFSPVSALQNQIIPMAPDAPNAAPGTPVTNVIPGMPVAPVTPANNAEKK